jgi:polysaccharide deacetylase family protein (PEP-CTERM system associated)
VIYATLAPEMDPERPTLLLSVDFEDWHQLMRRRIGIAGWEEPGPALERQTDRLLALLDELRIRATFFVLGMTARSRPDLVGQVAEQGHEIGCHGDLHHLVSGQTQAEFAADVRRSCSTIEGITGNRPVGYRAPAFSITSESPWAYEVLAAEGFAYDASQHDSPWIRNRAASPFADPHPLTVAGRTLWEFPVAVWQSGVVPVPVGGASYWSVMPTQLILKGLGKAPAMAGLYLHPYELDPEPLRPDLPDRASTGQRAKGRFRAAQRNLARRRAPEVLRAIARRYRLIPYGEAHAKLSRGAGARP